MKKATVASNDGLFWLVSAGATLILNRKTLLLISHVENLQ
jgi:hypothetical protein